MNSLYTILFLAVLLQTVHCDFLYKVKCTTNDQVDRLDAMKDVVLWKEAVINRYILISSSSDHVTDHFTQLGLDYTLITDDLHSLMKNYAPSITAKAKMADGDYFDTEKFIRSYNTFNNILQYLKHLESTNPDIVKLIEIGRTYENRSLTVIKVGIAEDSHVKTAIWIDSLIHAREWLSGASLLWVINNIVADAFNDDQINRLLKQYDFYFLPVFNPDGYAYTWDDFTNLNKRLWRYNRAPTQCIDQHYCKQEMDSLGTDLNRNFDDGHWNEFNEWRKHGSWPGEKPFSELETRAVSNYILNHESPFIAFVNLHAYGEVVIPPFTSKDCSLYKNNTRSKTFCSDLPEEYAAQMEPMLIAMRDAFNMYGNNYMIDTPAGAFGYAAGGGSIVWAYEKLGIVHSYSPELRPSLEENDPIICGNSGATTCGFLAVPEAIEPTALELYEGIKVLAEKCSQL